MGKKARGESEAKGVGEANGVSRSSRSRISSHLSQILSLAIALNLQVV